MQLRKLVPLFLATALLAACSDGSTTTSPDLMPAMNHNAQGGAEMGFTDGWLNGKTVKFFYNKPFFCAQPPASGATSGCEIGAESETPPRGGDIPTLYVMTPLGFNPGNLQCPTAGSCINHPSTLDASRVFGAGAENIPLPPHSHIIDETQAGWWNIEVIGVLDPDVWAQIASAKDLATVRALQASQPTKITGDIPSNLYLFFGVRQ